MKELKDFEEFLRKGSVKKQKPDESRARFLVNESNENYSFLLELLNKFEIEDNNSNTFIKSCYDILMEIIRAKMLLDGYSASGFDAHKAEIAYLKILNFEYKDTEFLDKMRFFRNGMMYYGTILDKEYAEKVVEFTKKSYLKLRSIVDNNN